jgi:hypothetical protein
MAKILEVYTMKGSGVIARMAGIESTAKRYPRIRWPGDENSGVAV